MTTMPTTAKKGRGRPSGVVDRRQVKLALDRSIAELQKLRTRLAEYWRQTTKKGS